MAQTGLGISSLLASLYMQTPLHPFFWLSSFMVTPSADSRSLDSAFWAKQQSHPIEFISEKHDISNFEYTSFCCLFTNPKEMVEHNKDDSKVCACAQIYSGMCVLIGSILGMQVFAPPAVQHLAKLWQQLIRNCYICGVWVTVQGDLLTNGSKSVKDHASLYLMPMPKVFTVDLGIGQQSLWVLVFLYKCDAL